MKYSNNINIIDKSNPLFTLAQDALEKEKNDQQQYDVTQKLKLAWSHFRPAKSNLSPTHVASTAAVAAAAAVDDNNVENPKSKWSFLLQAVRKKEQQQSVGAMPV
ncbi:unnamed protein product [Rotaria magnacalcarata]|uniref:Uncharacterized protein n=1 Tax=Rotaria magnacalcarata TaxID=392030 RepID=A0A8S3E9N0_9BILA|nr:unnamed protein product [Rotaria magnacalcarata]